jgi:hypothetical protein
MMIGEAERSLLEKTGRHLIFRIICGCLVAQMAWLFPPSGLAEEEGAVQDDPPSNEEFLRESCRSLLEGSFVDFPRERSLLLHLKSEEEHPANWLLEEELVSYLVASDYEVTLEPRTQGGTLQGSHSLSYRIIEMSLRYPEVRRKGFLGGRNLVRRARLNLSFRLEDTATGKVLWSKRAKEESSDLIRRSMIESVNNRTYPFLSPSLPDDPQSRYLEPALVVAVAGGLIYLFFANR